MPTVATSALGHVALRRQRAAEVGAGVAQVERPDVGARIRQAGGAVGQTVEREVICQRAAVELRLETREALSRGVHVQGVARQQACIVREVERDETGAGNCLQPGHLLPVAVDLEEDLPAWRRTAETETGLT